MVKGRENEKWAIIAVVHWRRWREMESYTAAAVQKRSNKMMNKTGHESTGKSVPSYERLSGKCFKGCVQKRKLFTIYSRMHSHKQLTLNLSFDGMDFPVFLHPLESFGKRRKYPIIAHYRGNFNYDLRTEFRGVILPTNAVLCHYGHLHEGPYCDCFECQVDYPDVP